MTLLVLLAAIQATPTETAARFDKCVALARTDSVAARAEAARWTGGDGEGLANKCVGLAYTTEADFTDAAVAFEAAGRAAQTAHRERAAQDFAQAGNAWLAAGEPAKARAALDLALLQDTLTGLQLGEAQLDHARALVAAGETAAARGDIDRALRNAADDPLAWLLSATLARRMGDPARAAVDIAQALARSPDDASVQLEAGNIAALAGDAARAKEAWGNAARIAPQTPVGRNAKAALAQFGSAPPTEKPAEGR